MTAALLMLALLASFQVAEPETPANDEAQAVAEEIVRIREALGGSIADPAPRDPVPNEGQAKAPRAKRRGGLRPRKRHNPVALLRQTALRLDIAAHRLEVAALYEDADRLRATAQGLRLSARGLAPARAPDKP